MRPIRFLGRGAASLVALAVIGLGTAAALATKPAVPPQSFAQPAPTPNATPVPTSAEAVQELAERLLVAPYVDPSGQRQQVSLLPGRLPDGLPLALPVPPGARLIGSALRGTERNQSVDVVLDVPAPLAETGAFYDQALATQGWVPAQPDSMAPAAGFQQTSSQILNRSYCAGPTSPYLLLVVYGQPQGTSDVRVTISPAGANPCATQGPGSPLPKMSALTAGDLMPALQPPPGVVLLSDSGPGGPPQYLPPGANPPGGLWSTRQTSSAVAETAMEPAELATFFAQQLADRGWVRLDGSESEAIVWSRWQPTTRADSQGILAVFALPGGNRRGVYLRVDVTAPAVVPASPVPAPTPGQR